MLVTHSIFEKTQRELHKTHLLSESLQAINLHLWPTASPIKVTVSFASLHTIFISEYDFINIQLGTMGMHVQALCVSKF